MLRRSVWCWMMLTMSWSVQAEVRLANLFQDHMVLQQGQKVAVWGTAAPGERVTVSLAGKQASALAGEDGRWRVELGPLAAGGPFEMRVEGQNALTLQDVLVGEVWVCSGQSNMAWPVERAANPEQEISQANYPLIRFFTVRQKVAQEPQSEVEGTWEVCSPQTVGHFSAVGYFFARELHRTLGVPVGMINSSWGGTPAEAWTSRPALEADPALRPILENWERVLANYPQALQRYQERLKQWGEEAAKAKAEGRAVPPRPQPPLGPGHPWTPGGLFNGMIAPLTPFAIRGVIWYQGESNAGRAYQYRRLFPTLIQDWRRAWGRGDFPFLFVQLANFMKTLPEPSESAWAELREAQSMALSLPKTGMAVAIDIGEADDIHPKNKQEVGRRLALAALAIAYGKDVVYSGPLYESMSIEGNRIRLRFKHVDGGLVAKDGEGLKGFAIAGEDRKFVWAEARIEGDTVVVSSPQVPNPVAVRYAWADNPVCNLYNRAGLPASPFRTDDWPGVTAPKE